MTETAWQRTSKYESSVQSPPQTTIWQLATHLKLQNAPQITLPAALPTCSWNEDLGKKRWERGNPPKKSEGWKNNRKPEKLRTNPDFGRAMILKTKTHKDMVKEQKRTSAKQDRHQEMNSTSGLLKDRITATQQGRTKKNDIIQNEQLATVVLKFKPQVADKSEIKSTTIETCILDKLKFSSLNVADNILCM